MGRKEFHDRYRYHPLLLLCKLSLVAAIVMLFFPGAVRYTGIAVLVVAGVIHGVTNQILQDRFYEQPKSERESLSE